MSKCDRCHQDAAVTTMSRFNTQMICVGDGSCEEREQAHPQYAAAKEAEEAAVRGGDYNFPGVGLPTDLRQT